MKTLVSPINRKFTLVLAAAALGLVALAPAAQADGPPLVTPPQISAGKATTCAVFGIGALSCWGSNSDGQRIDDAKRMNYSGVSVGAYHTCVARTDNSVNCFGDNHFGQTVPVGFALSSIRVQDLSLGRFHSCAVLITDTTLKCWGLDYNGQATAPPGPDYSRVSSGGFHSCALKYDGALVCWGGNWAGQANAPAGRAPYIRVSAGRTHSCAVASDGGIECWGENPDGRATAPTDGGYADVSAGYTSSCGLKTDGSINCWGSNSSGQLNAPAGTFTSVSVGDGFACARRADFTVACWGNNSDGQTTIPNLTNALWPKVTYAKGTRSGSKWTVSIKATSTGTRVRKVQFSSSVAAPSDYVAAGTSLTAFASKVSGSGPQPTWIRVANTSGRLSPWYKLLWS